MRTIKTTVNFTAFAGVYEAATEAELAQQLSTATGEQYDTFEDAILALRRKGAIPFIEYVDTPDPVPPAPTAPQAEATPDAEAGASE